MQASAPTQTPRPAWRLDWLTPVRCRLILLALLAVGFLGHLRFLTNDCPFDLSGDEAHYWDWSRELDWNYYSKGPLVAWIIRGSCAVFGNTMFAVRLPALVLAILTALLTYSLAKRLFRSERLALGVVLLNHLVPMFIAGSLLMTIDPPFFFCWAAATYLAALALLENRRWAWVGVGLALGFGFLAKYSMGLWLVGLGVFFIVDRPARRQLRTVWPYLSIAIALLFTIPVLLWNARHGWVTLHHVTTQTGASDPALGLANFAEFLAAQIGVVGPPLFVIMAGAVVWAMRMGRDEQRPEHRASRYLLWIGLPFFVLVMLDSLVKEPQPNWPAPAYFSLIVLAGYFLSTRMADTASWRRWRGWLWAALALGLLVTPLVHRLDVLYPLAARLKAEPRFVDPSLKLRGWSALGGAVANDLADMGDSAFVICEDYQMTAEMAFYVPGQPKTYCAGPYFAHHTKRLSQYDIWPDRYLGRPVLENLLGRNAVFVGHGMTDDIRDAFGSVREEPSTLPIIVRGVEARQFRWWRCYGFVGMERQPGGGSY